MTTVNTPTFTRTTIVRDPICGMGIDPGQAFATRQVHRETVYLCCKRCAEQFDREHATSAMTGTSSQSALSQIELLLTTIQGQRGAERPAAHLSLLASVRQVLANPTTETVHTGHDPTADADWNSAFLHYLLERGDVQQLLAMSCGERNSSDEGKPGHTTAPGD